MNPVTSIGPPRMGPGNPSLGPALAISSTQLRCARWLELNDRGNDGETLQTQRSYACAHGRTVTGVNPVTSIGLAFGWLVHPNQPNKPRPVGRPSLFDRSSRLLRNPSLLLGRSGGGVGCVGFVDFG